MSWRNRLQSASFRGVPFFVESSSASPGRRVEVIRFPGREDVVAQDLGRDADQFSVTAFVVGEDYDLARNALEDALLTSGPGTLVLPTRGSLLVVVEGRVQIEESKARGGYASFTFNVVRSTPTVTPSAPSNPQQVVSSATNVVRAANRAFAKAFSVVGMPSAFLASAVDKVRQTSQLLGSAHAQMGELLDGSHALVDAIDALGRSAETSLADPLELAGTTQGLIRDVIAIGAVAANTTIASVAAVRDAQRRFSNREATRASLRSAATLREIGADDVPIDESTPLRAREKKNRKALNDLVAVTAAAEIARAAASLPFSSWEEALAAREQIMAYIDEVGAEVDDETYTALAALRVRVVDLLLKVASTLPELRTHVVSREAPALVIAHQVYGNARREEEIVARNAIANPALIPAGAALEVTSA